MCCSSHPKNDSSNDTLTKITNSVAKIESEMKDHLVKFKKFKLEVDKDKTNSAGQPPTSSPNHDIIGQDKYDVPTSHHSANNESIVSIEEFVPDSAAELITSSKPSLNSNEPTIQLQ